MSDERQDKRTTEQDQPERVVKTHGGSYVEGDINTGGGDFVARDKVDHHYYYRPSDDLREDKSQLAASSPEIWLAMYHQSCGELTNHLTLYIPTRPADNKRTAEQIGVRLYLINKSGKMARYFQIELRVFARFFAYDYKSDPLTIDEYKNRWRIEKIDSRSYRCFFEGGQDFVSHSHGDGYIDLGFLSMLVPHGEADGGSVTVTIRYSIEAEAHRGSGPMTIWLRPATDLQDNNAAQG